MRHEPCDTRGRRRRNLPLLARSSAAPQPCLPRQGEELAWLAQGEPLPLHTLQELQRHDCLWVAADGQNAPVGFAGGAELLDGQLFIVELSVALPQQRQGLGTRLLDAAAALDPWGAPG